MFGVIKGTGMYVPEYVMDNNDIAKFVEWARIDGGGSKIVEISAIGGSCDLLREIKALLLNPGIAKAMAKQWGGDIREEL